MLKGIKNTLAVIGGITVASVIYKTAKKIKESGVTMKDIKKQGEHIAESMDEFVEKKKAEKEAKLRAEKEAEEIKEEVKEVVEVVEKEDSKEENNQG